MQAHPDDKSVDKSQPQSREVAPDASPDPAMQGEGNYTAARRHRKSVETFVADGKVDQAAHDAAPDNPEEARDMKAAEDAGRARARK